MTLLPIFLLALVASATSQCPDQASGLQSWSSLYASSSDVSIPAGTSVLYDGTATINTLEIFGTLVFSDSQDVSLTAHWIIIRDGGALHIGSESCRYQHKAIITLTGVRTTNVEMGSDVDGIAFGTKGIACANGGTLELHGALSTPSWTHLAATAQIGATTITLEESVNWKAGDRIIIATTDFPAYYEVPDQNEYKTVASVSGNTVTLDSALKYMHWGAGYEKAEVGLLSRNIIVRGTNDSSDFGGHIMVRKAKSVHIEGVELSSMGQKGILGRYPLHFHMMYEVYGSGFYAKDLSIHHNFQRCIAIHDSHGLLLQNNVAYDTIGHCYFLEDGGERGNVLDHNLGVLARVGSLIPSDEKPTNFWITNPNNTFTNNAAVSATFGYWFSLPDHPVGGSKAAYAASTTVWPSRTPLALFKDNVAHSQDRTGLMVDEMIQDDGSTPLGSYEPQQGPYQQDVTGTPVMASFEGTIAYKCRDFGVWTRGGYLHVYNTVALDNTHGILCVPGPSFIENAYVVGETDNYGLPLDYWGMGNYNNRSRPVGYSNAIPVFGVGCYDSFYAQFYKNITLENFQSNNLRRAGGLFALSNGKFILYPNNEYKEFTFKNAIEVGLEPVWPNEYCDDETNVYCRPHDGPKGVNWMDLDGSITGMVGGWVVSDNKFMVTDDCTYMEAWRAYKCPPFERGYLQFQLDNKDTGSTDFRNSLSQWIRASWYNLDNGQFMNITGGDTDSNVRTQYTANVRAMGSYSLRWEHPTPSHVAVSILGATNGAWAVLAIPYPAGTTFTITTGWNNAQLTRVNNLADLAKMTYYFDDTHLYVRVENTDNYPVNEELGFTWSTSWGASIDIVASCSNCDVGGVIGANPVPALPAPYKDRADKYEVDLVESGCQKVGHGFLSWDATSHVLYYSIEHNLGADASVAVITDGAGGVVNLELNSALSPIRGYLSLSATKEVKLFTGKLFLQVGTASRPDYLSGTIGCVGSCSTPASIPKGDMCTVDGSSIELYNEGLASGWSSWSWGGPINANWNYAGDAACGSQSASTQWNMSSAVSLHNDKAVPIDTSVYTFFEFMVKTQSGQVEFYVSFNEEEGHLVQSDEIVNYVVENTWTRVRVPISRIALPAEAISRVTISSVWMTPQMNLFFDNIRFVTNAATDVLVAPTTEPSFAYKASTLCGNVATSGLTGGVSGNPGGASNDDGDSSSAASLVANLVLIACVLFALL